MALIDGPKYLHSIGLISQNRFPSAPAPLADPAGKEWVCGVQIPTVPLS
jgi:hypothetical protein